MALIRPSSSSTRWCCARRACWRAPGGRHVEGAVRVRVWDDEVADNDMGARGGAMVLRLLGQRVRLVRFRSEQRRLSSLDWTGGAEAPNQFSDA